MKFKSTKPLFAFKIDKTQHEKLRYIAFKKRKSMGFVAREAIKQFLDQHQMPGEKQNE